MPTGPVSLAVENLRRTLADAAGMRAFLGADTQAQALARIYGVGLPEPNDGREYTPEELSAYRPFAIVGTSKTQGYTRRRDSIAGTIESGRLRVQLEWEIPEELLEDANAAEAAVLDHLGAIIRDVLDLGAGTAAGYLDITEIALSEGPEREKPLEKPSQGEFYQAFLDVAWGGGQ